ncbi:MAG: efflux RND transporter permease subunit, partial [Deltaproteobacteria bacterium]|nr:efflux RND transporter permease subunit [Deltaproteobacteria bacterium]
IGSFWVMNILGFTINSMTMLALSLCVGLVVDDAIVVLENIFRHAEMGKSSIKASQEGTSEIAFAAIAATLTIVAVFVPVAFIKGMIGRFYFQFGISVAAAVLISLFIALTLTPMLCSRYLSMTRKHGKIYEMLENAFLSIERSYSKALSKICLRGFWYRFWFALVSTVLTFTVSALFFGMLKKELITSGDQSDFFIQFKTPVGSSLELTDRKMAQMEAVMRSFPEVSSVFAALGGFQRDESNRGMLFIQLVDPSKREMTQQEIMAAVRRKFAEIPGLLANVQDISIGGVHGERDSPLQFDIKGHNLMELYRVSEGVVKKIREIPGIVDVDTGMDLTKPEVRIYIDRDRAGDLGVDVRTIASAVNTLIGGEDVGKYKEGGKSYDVRVRLVPDQREKPEDISRLLIKTSNGELIRLNNVVRIEEAVGPDVINRKDRMRSVTIYGNLEEKTLGEALKESKEVAHTIIPEGYTLTESGQAETMKEAIASLIFAFLLAIVITYMVLSSQFESFIHPLTIMLALPLSFIGALGFLLLTGNTLNVMSYIGMIMLMGIVTKNSILLVDYTNTLRSKGKPRDEAVLEAAPVRLRPILMTAISTIAGVLPVALGFGAGGESRAPMAIATAGGLATSTLLTLFIVPVVYMLL